MSALHASFIKQPNWKTTKRWGGHNWRKVSASTKREITNGCKRYGLEKPDWKKTPNANKLVEEIVARYGLPGEGGGA